jgi:thiol:disulfide interchange protein DsbD
MMFTTKRSIVWLTVAVALAASSLGAQVMRPDPVFGARLMVDRDPVVAGDDLRLAVAVAIDRGWHVNSDEPGDEFSLPTTVQWTLPEGWVVAETEFPDGEELSFEFSDGPIEVWEGTATIVATVKVPASAAGETVLGVKVIAQACNDTQCLPPTPVNASTSVTVAPAGTQWRSINQEAFAAVESGPAGEEMTEATDSRFGGKSLPLLIVTVFLAGLALNLTPCVYPLIPITVGFFAQQAKERSGGTFGLALTYVLGMSVTYSVLGVTAALTGRLFGTALQNPWVVGGIVAVMLALAASMFGLWELRVPGWAMRASGGRSGVFGALLMGLVVGFVAAPCIGPFVLGLLTYVGKQGSPLLGFILFFTLAMGLGLPYLLLGTFTGMMSKLPASGMWMVGVRKVFGFLLIALAVYFAGPFLPGNSSSWVMAAVLILGGLYLLVVDRTGHEQSGIDRMMRLVSAGMIVVGVFYLPLGHSTSGKHLEWQAFDPAAAQAAITSGGPVIIDFYADWCAPCRELDEQTFADPAVAAILSGFARFKVDQTKSNEVGDAAAVKYEVMGMPTVIVFQEGEEKFRITGFEPPETFIKRIQ